MLSLSTSFAIERLFWGGEGLMEPPFLGFRSVTIFRKDFTFSREPLMCCTRGGTYYGLPRCLGPVTSSKMGAILDFTENWELSKR